MDRLGVRQIYDRMVERGQHPNMAAMLAAQQPPASKNTDSDFQRRECSRMRSMDEEQREHIAQIARRAGINTAGKTYNGQLGKYSDPLAWVSDTNDVKQAAVQKNLRVEGMVNVDAYRDRKPKKKRIAKDILDSLERRARLRDSSLNERCKKSATARKDLREALTEKHTKKPKD